MYLICDHIFKHYAYLNTSHRSIATFTSSDPCEGGLPIIKSS